MQSASVKDQNILQLTFHSDPGHGWLQVPHSLIWELGIQSDISPYSYADDSYVYLEEDCDYSVFMRAIEAKGLELKLNERSSDVESKIRDMRQFDASVAPVPADHVDVTIAVTFDVTDGSGTARIVQESFNWMLSPDSCREDLAKRMAEEIDRQSRLGWLQGKSLNGVSIASVIRNMPDGRFQDFPVLIQS